MDKSLQLAENLVMLQFLEGLKQGPMNDADPTVQHLLKAGACMIRDDLGKVDDKASLIMAFMKSIGMHVIGQLADTGRFPGIDASTRMILSAGLLEVLTLYYRTRFDLATRA